MMADINITMIGGSGSGKTTYMLAMYEDMRYGYGGFNFAATDPDIDQRFSMEWEEMEILGERRKWPPLSTEAVPFDFDLLFAFERFLTFRWLDYPGGNVLIRNSSTEIAEELKDQISRSVCVLIVVPGDQLFEFGAEREPPNKLKRKMHIADINRLLMFMRSNFTDDDVPSVVLLVTKSDLFDRRFGEDSEKLGINSTRKEHLVECLKKVYPQVLTESSRIHTLICPVTLGRDLAYDGTQGLQKGEIDPKWVHLPVLFAYSEYAKRLRRGFNDLKDGYYDDRHKIGNNAIKRWWNNDEISDIDKKIKEVGERLNIIEDRLRVIDDAMPQDIVVYRNGVEQ